MSADRAALVRQLVERLGRHRPHFLSERQVVGVIRRLIAHAAPGERGCALWMRTVNNDGYGKMNVRLAGRVCQLYVHQLAFALSQDPRPLPPHMHVGHQCDTPPCFHPEHVGAERREHNQRRAAENTNRKKARRARLSFPWGGDDRQASVPRRAA